MINSTNYIHIVDICSMIERIQKDIFLIIANKLRHQRFCRCDTILMGSVCYIKSMCLKILPMND